MIIVDRALEKREEEGNPVKVAMIGAGFMGRAIAYQIISSVRGMRLVAISNRHTEKAIQAYAEAGIDQVRFVSKQSDLDHVAYQGKYCVTDNPSLLTRSHQIDAIIDATGSLNFAAPLVVEALNHKKHVILMNAELDGTLGPLFKKMADKHDVIYTNVDGDQPGVLMNLYRFLKGIGAHPVLCGNIKGLFDPYRNPSTQQMFARKWGQKAHMVASFADGTKVSFEQAVIANATGMTVAKRGMIGPTVPAGTPLQEAVKLYSDEMLLNGPAIVDYLVGAEPNPGVFILGTHPKPSQRNFLKWYKMGDGPLYCFYTPYHLCHFEVPMTVARAVIFGDAAVTPLGRPYVDVVATAKMDLKEGQVLDGVGFYMTYGQCERTEIVLEQNLLPMGLAEGCRLKRDVTRDEVLTYEDVEIPKNSVIHRLRLKQDQLFEPEFRRSSAVKQEVKKEALVLNQLL